MADIIKIADFATSIITKKSFQSSYEILRRGVADSGPHHVTSKKMSNVQRQFSVVKWQWRLFKPWIAVIQIHRPFKRLRRRTGVGSRSMLTRGGGGIGGRVVEGRSLLTELVSWWRLLDRRLALWSEAVTTEFSSRGFRSPATAAANPDKAEMAESPVQSVNQENSKQVS